jgi:hypothetical protein
MKTLVFNLTNYFIWCSSTRTRSKIKKERNLNVNGKINSVLKENKWKWKTDFPPKSKYILLLTIGQKERECEGKYSQGKSTGCLLSWFSNITLVPFSSLICLFLACNVHIYARWGTWNMCVEQKVGKLEK